MKRYSIMTNYLDRCYFCGSTVKVELHEVFFGIKNHDNSIKWGLVAPLCLMHHRGTNGIHGKNGHELDVWLKKRAQQAFITYYPNESFIEIFGKSYL